MIIMDILPTRVESAGMIIDSKWLSAQNIEL